MQGLESSGPLSKAFNDCRGTVCEHVSILAWLEEDGAGHLSHREAQGCSFAQVWYVLAKVNQCGSAYVFHIANLYDSRYCGAFDRARKIPLGPREFSFVLGPGKARLPDHCCLMVTQQLDKVIRASPSLCDWSSLVLHDQRAEKLVFLVNEVEGVEFHPPVLSSWSSLGCKNEFDSSRSYHGPQIPMPMF